MLNGIAVTFSPSHFTNDAIEFTCALGFTVIVNTIDVPKQLIPALVKVGMTVIVATSGPGPGLIATNGGRLLPPPFSNPILGLVVVHW